MKRKLIAVLTLLAAVVYAVANVAAAGALEQPRPTHE